MLCSALAVTALTPLFEYPQHVYLALRQKVNPLGSIFCLDVCCFYVCFACVETRCAERGPETMDLVLKRPTRVETNQESPFRFSDIDLIIWRLLLMLKTAMEFRSSTQRRFLLFRLQLRALCYLR